MEKKTITVHAVTVHIYTIAIVVMLLLIAVLGLKYLHLKMSVQRYTASTIWMNQQTKPNGKISDYGLSVAQATQFIPAADLQNYVASLSKTLSRDIVVVDSAQRILADTIPANKGALYVNSSNEVKMTISDGQTRVFEEKSADYPNGIFETVVPIRTAKGDIAGAVLISNDQVTLNTP